SPKNKAGVDRCRAQRQLNALTAVQANAHRLGQGFESSLSKHGLILISTE
ncbi:MAG: hypothetical protein ACI9LD_000073, partial [Polaromonas sp.]